MATPALRIRIAPKFPAKIQGSGGISVSRTGGVVTIGGAGVRPAATEEEMREGIDNFNTVTAERSAQVIREQVYPTRSDLLTIEVPGVQIGITTSGYSDVGDGGGARYKVVNSEPSHAGKFQTADGRWWEIAEPFINPKMLGAKFDWVSDASPGTDDTQAWRNAIAIGRPIVAPAGNTRVTDRVAFQNGQSLIGPGRLMLTFRVGSDFNMSASGVIRMVSTGGDANSELRGIGVAFYQPDTTVRANVIQYPPAIDAKAAARCVIDDIRITRAWNGIDTTGNAGGATFKFIEIGALNKGLIVDGALDFVHIDTYHFWAFGMTSGQGYPNLYSVFSDGQTIALDQGDCVSLDYKSITTFLGAVKIRQTNPSLSPLGLISALSLDKARLDVSGGRVTIGLVYASQDTGRYLADFSGGSTRIGQLYYLSDLSESQAIIKARSTASVTLSNARIDASNTAVAVVEVSGGASFAWHGGAITGVAGDVRTAPMIEQIAGHTGTITVRGLNVDARGAGSGEFVKIVADNYHNISGNQTGGWAETIPADSPLGLYGPNGGQGFQSWTPTFTFATPGDLVLSAVTATAFAWIEGGMVYFTLDYTFTPTFTTASGVARINGLPFNARTGFNQPLAISRWNGINTPGTATQMVVGAVAASGSTRIDLFASGDNVSNQQLQAGNFTSGTSVTLNIGGCYRK